MRMSEKVSSKPPSGFRDFLGKESQKREVLKRTISKVYSQHGFEPVDTPALENLKVLQGSGGQENEKLIFKTLKRGDKFKSVCELNSENENDYADLGLRFDLTVPLSRLVGEYQNEIQFPWKVFHIGPVWRAERAQKGRFREFYQCDVDIVGSQSGMAEYEVIQAATKAFQACGLKSLQLHLNHRSIIEKVAERFGFSDQLEAFAILLDKKDKISFDKLTNELADLSGSNVSEDLLALLQSSSSSLDLLESFEPHVAASLKDLAEAVKALGVEVKFDLSLVRGMGYYTGTLFEFRLEGVDYSIGGGGRYDHLLSRFSKKEFPAVGCSLGFERLLLHLQDQVSDSSARTVFVPNFGSENIDVLRDLCQSMRASGLLVDLYPEEAKLKSQLKFADQKSYRWVLIAGSEELKAKKYILKDLLSSQEERLDLPAVLSKVRGEKLE